MGKTAQVHIDTDPYGEENWDDIPDSLWDVIQYFDKLIRFFTNRLYTYCKYGIINDNVITLLIENNENRLITFFV